jgi:mono/diheme cytochrome c family protein
MRVLAFIGALALVAAAALAGYLFGGYYNVAATADDPGPVEWALVRIRQASIARHASASPPFSLSEPARIQDGARAFAQRGCVNCHGAPGASWAKFSEGLKPSPPDLKEIAPQAEPGQVFWVIKNGIRMTAMPSFGAIEVPDAEIWSMVAFIKALPSVTDEQFKAWTASGSSEASGKP